MFKTLIATAVVSAQAFAEDAFDFESQPQGNAIGAYSNSAALISRQLSADAYCGYKNYMSHTFEGAA